MEREVAGIKASLPGLNEELARCEARRDDVARRCDKAIDTAAAQLSSCTALHSSAGKLAQDLREAEAGNPRGRLADLAKEDTRYAVCFV